MSATSHTAGSSLANYLHPKNLPNYALHIGAVVGVCVVGFSWSGLLLALGLYYVRMFFVTGVYHRYFSHRSYKTSRWFQFLLAFFGGMSVQKGAIWWSAHHRVHHKYSDTPEDPHSPRQRGVLYAHIGWIMNRKNDATPVEQVKDWMRYPELVWLNRFHLVPVAIYAATLYLTLGLWGFVWGFVVSTVLLWHGTFTINSLSHVFGTQPFKTPDDSRNNFILAMITMGEGWHNNHHHYQSCANQGFYWWQIDMSYYVLRALGAVGLIWDIRKTPARVLAEGRGLQVSEDDDDTTRDAKAA